MNDPENKPIEEWMDKHGSPSFAYLQSLVDDGNPRAIEILQGIADHYDAQYTQETTPDELVEIIVLALKSQ